ncbi:hypothetical protein Bbelb_264510 [Branchiostoma belcheri]|nr:hypothetical protein Bbelb_264510 [Branchiostoma belcheri]
MCDYGYTKLRVLIVSDDYYECQVDHPSQRKRRRRGPSKEYRERSLACMAFRELYEDFSDCMERLDLGVKLPTEDAMCKKLEQWYTERVEIISRDPDDFGRDRNENQVAGGSQHVRALVRDIVIDMLENTPETAVGNIV